MRLDAFGSVNQMSYGVLHKPTTSSIPVSNQPINSEVSTDWAVEENYSILDWFKKCLRHYVTFKGRTPRKEYWYFTLVLTILTVSAAILDNLLELDEIITGLVCLVFVVPSIAVSVRRLHDINKSGWGYLISIIPFIGSLMLLVLMVRDTYPETNQWGKPARKIG